MENSFNYIFWEESPAEVKQQFPQSEALTGKNITYIWPCFETPETKAKRAAALRGRTHSAESKARMSSSQRERRSRETLTNDDEAESDSVQVQGSKTRVVIFRSSKTTLS